MPSTRRRRLTEIRAPLSPCLRHYLLTGRHDGTLAGRWDPFLTGNEAAWADSGADLIEEFVDASPGRRPWGFWMFQARTPRAVVGGTGQVLTGWAHVWREDYGRPMVTGADPTNRPMVESEPAYLRRHHLALPGELRRVPARDFAPEVLPVAPDDENAALDDEAALAELTPHEEE